MMSDSAPGRRPDIQVKSGERDPDRTALDWPRHAGTTHDVLQEIDTQVRLLRNRRRRRRSAFGAVLMLVLISVAWRLHRPGSEEGMASTIVASPAREILADGSLVQLRPGAVVATKYEPAVRRVVLTKGEAHFDVRRDPERPFVVEAAGVEIRAVGTAFSVSLEQSAVEVLVTQGEVAVEKPAGASEAPMPDVSVNPGFMDLKPRETLARVPAGNSVLVEIASQASALPVTPLTDLQLRDRLAWRIPRLEFSRTRLAEIVADVNRYSTVQLVLADAVLGDLRLSGAIRADNVNALLQLLEAEHGVKIVRRTADRIVLRQER